MEIDFKDFNERLNKELVSGNQNILGFTLDEIRKAEIMKAELMEEMNEQTKGFLNDAANKLDTYIFQLQEKVKELHPTHLPLDMKTALDDEKVRQDFKKSQNELEDIQDEMEAEKDPDV